MRTIAFWTSALFWIQIQAQAITLTGTNPVTGSGLFSDYQTSGVTYASDVSTQILSPTTTYGSIPHSISSIGNVNSTAARNATATTTVSPRSSSSSLILSGTVPLTSSTLNGTATSRTSTSLTATAVRPSNTVPCNGFPQLCSRKYSNITHVAAHNSPFVRQGNIAANQMLDVTTQLNDGIRMLQFQSHYENNTIYLCHTSCSLLNAGTLYDYLVTVRQWLDENPYDVVTILMGNSDRINPRNYTIPILQSGIIDYVYTPPQTPMPLSAWPTLGQMILTGQRVVVMLDYGANQTAIPWLLDEFSQMWETPFSPTNRDFPCTVQRPPNQSPSTSKDRMYMANHNLNVQVNVLGLGVLVPATTILNETNADLGYGSAAVAIQNCTSMWNRPPSFLLVDFYNIGNFNGSVFQVAATANGLQYNRNSCCGTVQRAAATRLTSSHVSCIVAAIAVMILLFI